VGIVGGVRASFGAVLRIYFVRYRHSGFIVALSGLILVALGPVSATAQITRLEIVSRTTSNDPAFGAVGPYEIIKGRAYGDLDPQDRRNRIIQDVTLAPRNARGRVPYVATFTLARPVDASKASGLLMYNVVNRGNGDVAPDPAGHLWLVSGWQGDVRPTPNNQTVEVPTAVHADGSPVLGLAIARFSNLAPGTTTVTVATPRDPNATGGPIYRQAAADQSAAALISVASETTTGQQTGVVRIPRATWAFADCRSVSFPGTPDRTRVCLKGGFDATRLYQLVYTAQDPLVLGVGLAATRDLVSYFRYSRVPENPLAGAIRHVVSLGNSQSGNFIKTFIHLGFNEDLAGRIVWDGAFPRIAGRQTPMNFRFALPGGAGSLYEPGSEGVLTWGSYTDTKRGRPADSLLDRCTATRTCPKVIEAFGSTEFWGLRMSPGLIGTDATTDVPLPANVRRFYYPGTSHGGGAGGFRVDLPAPGPNAGCSLPGNPNPQSDQTRALTVALVEWVTKGTEPPASRSPLLSRGELVPATRAAMGFPHVPQIPFTDDFVNAVLDYDFGRGFLANDLSGTMSLQPPRIVQVIPTFVPTVNEDGNEIAGAPSVLHQAPLATYLGWNVTASGFAKGRICGFSGGAVQFAKTRAERLASGDPRLSVEERYGTLEGYMCVVRAAAERMVADRLLLRADADRTIRQAQESEILPRSTVSSAEARAIEVRVCSGGLAPRVR
jgi:Alpha/beta hydrolase domain